MSSLFPHYSLRVPEELLNKLRYTAQLSKRSLNKEIEFILEKYILDFEKDHGTIKTKKEK